MGSFSFLVIPYKALYVFIGRVYFVIPKSGHSLVSERVYMTTLSLDPEPQFPYL